MYIKHHKTRRASVKPYNNDTCFFPNFHDPCLYIYIWVYVWYCYYHIYHIYLKARCDCSVTVNIHTTFTMIATLYSCTPFLSCLVQPYYDRPAQSTCHDGHTVLQCACGEDDTVTPAQLWDVRVPLHADLQLSSCCRVRCVMVCDGVLWCTVVCVWYGGK